MKTEKGLDSKEEKTFLSQEIKDNKENLESDNFISVDLKLSDIEKDILREIKIEKELAQFNYYGPLGPDLEKNLETYFKEMGDNQAGDISVISKKVAQLAEGMVEGFDKEAAWVMVRVSLPNDEFEIPRPHPDGRYFKSLEKVYKLVATLKGAHTLFAKKADEEKWNQLMVEHNENYNKNEGNEEEFKKEDLRIRKELMKVVEPMNIVKDGQGVVYLVGNKDAVIHSEPHITEPRIFLAVLPGSKEEIKEWKGNK